MKEIIESIKEGTFKVDTGNRYNPSMDGYIIKTNIREIKLGISNSQACCENWGYFSTPDDPKDFIGSELLSVSVTDKCLNTKELENRDVYESSAIFITLETNKGTFQLTVYNEHNGYYGHEVYIQIGDKVENTSL